MWDQEKDKTRAEGKVSQMERTHRKPLIDEGARHLRFQNTPKSAWDIVRDATGETEVLLLQEELVDAEMKLNETSSAGTALCSKIEKLLLAQGKTMKQLPDEAKAKDPALAREFEEEYKKIEAQLKKIMQDVDKLKIGWLRRLILKLFRTKTRSTSVLTWKCDGVANAGSESPYWY